MEPNKVMLWQPETQTKFKTLISRIPVFHRHITESVVVNQAEKIALERGAKLIEDQDVIAAFFSDVPSPVYSMMVRLLEQTGFDYKKFGFPKPQGDGGACDSRNHKEG